MSTGAVEIPILFTFNDPKPGSPPAVTVRYSGTSYTVYNDGTPVVIQLQPAPPAQNELLSMMFRDDYYPLPLYSNGTVFGVPLLSGDGEPSILVPLHFGIETTITVYPINPDRSPGQARIVIDAPTGDLGIGLLIVGTSGLWEGEN